MTDRVIRPRKDPHLPPCVYHKNGAYWYVKRNAEGKLIWHRLPPTGPSTLAEALAAYALFHQPPKEAGMSQLIADALADMAKRKPPLATNTLKQYAEAAKILKRKLAQFEPGQVQERHVAAIKNSMKATPNMCNRCLSFLRQVFAFGLEEGTYGLIANPALGTRRNREGKRDRLITLAEYQAIYAHADDRLQVIMDLLVRTGQRVTAVLKIRRDQLLEEGIRFGKHKTDLKGIVTWTPELRAVIERAKGLPMRVRSLVWLLISISKRKGPQKGQPVPVDYRTVVKQWRTACKAAGVEDAQLRDLRAMAATEAKRQGKNPTALLLHTSEAQTRRYLRGKEEPLVEGPSFDGTKPVER